MEEFLKSPIVILIGWIGGVAGILSIPLTLYLSSSNVELTYHYDKDSYFNVVNKSNFSKLHVYHDDMKDEIKSNLSFLKIKIWNSGDKVIKGNDIREPIYIIADETVKILEAYTINQKNNVIDIAKTNIENKLKVKINILEPSEGDIVQLLYVGKNDAKFDIVGRIIGQEKIEKWNTLPKNSLFKYVFIVPGIIFLFTFFIVSFFLLVLKKTIYKNNELKNIESYNDKIASISGAAFGLIMIYLILSGIVGEWMIPI